MEKIVKRDIIGEQGVYIPEKPTVPEIINNNPPRGTFIVGDKLMCVCATCGKLVRLDKPILGSLHICE